MSENPSKKTAFSRRSLLTAGAVGAGSLALSACTSYGGRGQSFSRPVPIARYVEPEPLGYAAMYDAVEDGGFVIPAVPIDKVEPRFLRQVVADPTGEVPGTVVVDTTNHFLYLVRPGGEAMRYGVGLGREGFEWAGRGVIEWKQPWPRWFPPEEMIDREPELEKYRAVFNEETKEWEGGMPPGIMNPLGARALYIFQDGKDTLYRLHGSPEWWSIGKSVSSGCVRLMNQDIIDLYGRVAENSPIIVGSNYAVA